MEIESEISISSRASSALSWKSEEIRDLNDRLLVESSSRQEANDLYQRLQEEYDNLLAKHAQAENTIDQLRIGARIDLFSDGPKPHQAVESHLIEFKSTPRPILLSKSGRAQFGGPNRLTKDASAGTTNNDSVDGEERRKLSVASKTPDDKNLNVALRLKDLQHDIGAFQSALAERELSYEQQRDLYSALKGKHEKLRSEVGKISQKDGMESQGVGVDNR